MKEHCLNCNFFLECEYKHKSSHYVCVDWEAFTTKQEQYITDLFRSTVGEDGLPIASPTKIITPVSELNLTSMLDKVLKKDSLVPKDMRVDDGDIKEAPNFYTFVTSPRGLGVTPFPRQMFLALWLFSDFCPHCSDPRYYKDIHNIDVNMKIDEFPDHFQMLRFGVCPKCHGDRRQFFNEGLLHPYRELAMCVGQRGGKSIFTSILVAYLIHRYLKLQKPTEVYGLLPNTTITGTFVALTYQGAVELLWGPIRDLIRDSPWFKSMHQLLDHYNAKYDGEVYKSMDTFLHYKHRKMLFYASGPNKRTLRGRTRNLSAVDEIGWFTSDNEDAVKLSGDEIYTALDRSLLTIRASAIRLWKQGYINVPTAYAFNISSPSSARDKIMSLVKSNLTSRRILIAHLPTWEMNPNIQRSDLTDEYRNDPIKAERDYGANPPLSDSPYIEDKEVVVSSFSTTPNAVTYKYIHKKNRSGRTMRAAVLEEKRLPKIIPPSVLALDAGLSDNSFAMVIGHRNESKVAPGTQISSREPKLTVSTVIEVIPAKGMHINHARIMSDLVRPLIDVFNVQAVVADRWQSILLLHQLEEDYGLFTEIYSVKKTDFDLVKSYLLGSQISLPKLEMEQDEILVNQPNYPHSFNYKPVSHLLMQMLTVRDVGRTVTKGMYLTDDSFRAFNLCCTFLLDEDFASKTLILSKGNVNKNVGVAASMGGVASLALGFGQTQGSSFDPYSRVFSRIV